MNEMKLNKLLLFAMFLLFTININNNKVFADMYYDSNTVIYSGTCRNVDWTIDNKGVLKVVQANDMLQGEYEWDWGWLQYNKEIKKAVVDLPNPIDDCARMFEGCCYLESIEFIRFDTSNVTSMYSMFSGCHALTKLDLNNWNVINVKYMEYLFSGCTKLTELDINNWNVSNVVSMSGMFNGCNSLTELNIRNWDVSNVTSMFKMFNECITLTELDIRNWDVGNVRNMSNMFNKASSLRKFIAPAWNVQNLTEAYAMFNECNSLSYVDLSGWNTSNLISTKWMFGNCSELEMVNVSGWNVSNLEDMSYMFASDYSLHSINGINRWHTENIMNLSHTFAGCSFEELDLNNWNVSKVTDFSNCFGGCTLLKNLYIDSWKLESAEDISDMFYGCSNIKCRITLASSPTKYDYFAYMLNKDAYIIIRYQGSCTKEMADKIADIPSATSQLWVEGTQTTMNAYSLSIGNSITMNLYLKMAPDYIETNTYMFCDIGGNQYIINDFDGVEYDGKGYLRCKVDVPPAVFNQQIKCKLYSNGQLLINREVSAISYAKKIIDNKDNNEEFTRAQSVVKALLDYASYAQLYFNKNTGKLANEGKVTNDYYSNDDNRVYYDILYYGNKKLDQNTDDVKYYGMSLLCDGHLKAKIYFKYSNRFKTNISNYAIESYYHGTEDYKYTITDKYLIVEIDNINYSDLTDKFRIDIYNKNDLQDGIIFVASPVSYMKIAEETKNRKLINLNRAMFAFWQKAYQYSDVY